MGIAIGSNVTSLRAQRQLGLATTTLASTFERLSSGQRINKASDDAAGLAIAESLQQDGRVYSQALRNVNDGLSALNIARGALEQLSDISMRQKELAAQAANGTYSLTQRRAMNTEANALVNEYNRIVESTVFNGIHLTDKSLAELRVQAGYGSDGSVAFKIGDKLARTVGTGSFGVAAGFGSQPKMVTLGDLTGDGILDMLAAPYSGQMPVYIGNGNGTFKGAVLTDLDGSPEFAALADLNSDGVLDVAAASEDNPIYTALGNGNGTFRNISYLNTGMSCSALSLDDLTGDGVVDLAVADETLDRVYIFGGNGNGTFRAPTTVKTGNTPRAMSLADLTGDGIIDMITADGDDDKASVFVGNGDGTFRARNSLSTGDLPRAVAAGDLNLDGALDIVTGDWTSNQVSIFIGNGDGSFKAGAAFVTGDAPMAVSLGDVNGDGFLDVATADFSSGVTSLLIGNGDGSFRARSPSYPGSNPSSLELGDLNGDGALDMAVAVDSGASVLLANTRQVTSEARLNLCTPEGALDALDTIENTLQRISSELGAIGSTQSRLAVTLNTLAVARENSSAAAGRIMDADVAQESSVLVRAQILQQAGAAVLGQANQQPALALELLGG